MIELKQKLVKGRKGDSGGGGSYTPIEAANTLQSKATARVIDLICEGEIEGLVNGHKSIFFDDTPLQAQDNSYNFDGITIAERKGLPDQDYISGFPEIENEAVVGIEVKHDTPVIKTLNDPSSDAVRMTIRIPALIEQKDNGDLVGSQVKFQVEVKPNGGSYVKKLEDTIDGKTTSAYEKSYRIELSGNAPWDIKMTRITEDSETSKITNNIYWARYTVLKDYKLIYPDSALFGLTVDSRLFGNQVPERAYDLKLAKIQVPTNYNSETREYSGIWDGSFKTAWTDNPAWVFYAMLTNKRYGLGEYIDSAQVDKWALYEIAQYCDELVDDGFGGQEARYTFNGIINTRQEAFNVIQTLASVFRGMMYWGTDTITVTQDSPYNADPVLVNQANVIGGIFNYSGTAMKSRHSACAVTWNDPADAYRAQIEIVQDTEMVARFGWRQKDVLAYGCVSKGQAHRTGKWILDSEKTETELVTYQCSFDHLDVRPGQVIKIMDEAYTDVRLGGRIKSASLNSIILDTEITLNDFDYEISVVLPNGTIETKPIIEKNITTDIVTLTSALSDTPINGAIWIITGEIEARLFRVLSVVEKELNIFEITALYYDPLKYVRVEQDIQLESPDFTLMPSGVIAPPGEITIQEFFVETGPSLTTSALISWNASPDTRVLRYEIEVKKPGDTVYDLLGITSQLSIVLENTQRGLYSFRVRAVSIADKSVWSKLENYLIYSLSLPTADVDDFNIEVIGGIAVLTWSAVLSKNLSHYKIKFTPDIINSTWGSSFTIIDNVSKASNSVTVPAQVGTYLIKAVNTIGVECENSALIITTVAGIEGLNFIEEIEEHPDFLGVKEHTFVHNNRLRLGSQDTMDMWPSLSDVSSLAYGITGFSEGIYYFEDTLDLSAVYTSKLTPYILVRGIDVLDVMASWVTLEAVEKLLSVDSSLWEIQLQVRTTNDDLGASPVWTKWQNLIAGDYTARAFEFRINLISYHHSVTPEISELKITIDMPDRTESDNDVAISIGGSRVDYLYPFKVKPALALSTQDLNTGDYYVKSNENASGFDISFFDKNDAGVSKTIDYVAKGYGRKL